MPINTTFDGRTFEFQLGVSLYDEAYGTFYGNTCYSLSDTYDRGRAQQRNAIDLDMSFDVYYHTSVSDPRCMAVVEVIMLERMLDGVVKGQFSLGWAMLPLFRVSSISSRTASTHSRTPPPSQHQHQHPQPPLAPCLPCRAALLSSLITCLVCFRLMHLHPASHPLHTFFAAAAAQLLKYGMLTRSC